MDNKPVKVTLKKQTLAEKYPDLTISRHEDALICSARFELLMGFDEAAALVGEKMEGLRDWVNDNGAFVGHIKAALLHETRSALLSTTGEHVSAKLSEYSKVTVALTCISLLVQDESAYCAQVRAIKDSLTAL